MDTSQVQLNHSKRYVNPQFMWEAYRAEITELYATKTLQEVRDEMERRHNFTATTKQWKDYISKWKLNRKHIKPVEYRAMLRKKKEREKCQPRKMTQFILHGTEVPLEKLVRYEKREAKNKGSNGKQGDALTPPGLICLTPPIIHGSSLQFSRASSPSKNLDPSLPAHHSLIPTRLSPIPSSTSMVAIQSNPTALSPSIESFDWFNEYIEYSRSANNTPQAPANMLIELLLNFKEALHNYEEERSYQSFVENLSCNSCVCCEIIMVIYGLRAIIEDSGDGEAVQRIKRWARAAVQKTFQLGLEGRAFVEAAIPIAGSIGSLFLELGEPWQAKPFLEYIIVEMDRFEIARMGSRRMATLELARCNDELGNKTRAVELIQVLFKDLYPKLVALSFEDLDTDFHSLCTCHKEDTLVHLLLRRGIETSEEEWRVDAEEIRLRLKAMEVIKRLLPGMVQKTKEDGVDRAQCHSEGGDQCQ